MQIANIEDIVTQTDFERDAAIARGEPMTVDQIKERFMQLLQEGFNFDRERAAEASRLDRRDGNLYS